MLHEFLAFVLLKFLPVVVAAVGDLKCVQIKKKQIRKKMVKKENSVKIRWPKNTARHKGVYKMSNRIEKEKVHKFFQTLRQVNKCQREREREREKIPQSIWPKYLFSA